MGYQSALSTGLLRLQHFFLSVAGVCACMPMHVSVNEGLAQGPYVAARAEFEPTTLRSTAIDFTNEPPRPTQCLQCVFLFDSSIRRFAHFTVNLWLFDIFMLFMLCASTISLAVEDPVNSNAFRNTILNYLDFVFTAVFTVEMLLKVVSRGVHPPKQIIHIAYSPVSTKFINYPCFRLVCVVCLIHVFFTIYMII